MQTRDALLEVTGEEGYSPAAMGEVREALEHILESQPFRTSRQCRDLFRYMVEHSLSGQDGDLRERVLGVEVFGRASDYDTAEDPVVRMRAADVRKRLAQFYQAAAPQAVHIDLKPGSYRATFRFSPPAPVATPEAAMPAAAPVPAAEPPPPAVEPPQANVPVRARRSTRTRVLLSLAVVLVLLSVGVAVRWWTQHTATLQTRFWGPVTRLKQPVLVYVGSNVAYRFSPDYMSRYQQQHGMTLQNGPEFFPELHHGESLRADDLLPMKNTFITNGDLAASVQVTSLLSGWARPFLLRSAGDLSISDLRDAPAVFVGGFNNSWTLAATAGLPLVLRDGVNIVDKAHPEHRWSVDPNNDGRTTVDYALVSRVLHSSTGGPALILGGIGSYGTQAAAEFVCSPEKVNELLHDAPAVWESRNMQAVLQIQVVDYAPVSVRVVQTKFW